LARFGFAQRGSTSRQSRHERGRQCLTSHRHHKDILFPINETGTLRRSEAFESIRQAIYALTEGRERDRHSASGYAISDSSALTRTIFVSSTERSTDAYAKSVNESRNEGELARCLDVAATRAGRATVMDRGSGPRQPKI
jgi:hypothetical protein